MLSTRKVLLAQIPWPKALDNPGGIAMVATLVTAAAVGVALAIHSL